MKSTAYFIICFTACIAFFGLLYKAKVFAPGPKPLNSKYIYTLEPRQGDNEGYEMISYPKDSFTITQIHHTVK